jgi:multisubunit Na+/H+ antiporter MnhG subunit
MLALKAKSLIHSTNPSVKKTKNKPRRIKQSSAPFSTIIAALYITQQLTFQAILSNACQQIFTTIVQTISAPITVNAITTASCIQPWPKKTNIISFPKN